MGLREAATEMQPGGGHEPFLLALAHRLGGLTDPAAVMAAAAEALGRHLDADRCGYGEIELDQDEIVIPVEWNSGVPSAIGRFPLLRGSDFVNDYEAGRTVVVADGDALDLPRPVRASLVAMRCRAFVTAPLLDAGRLVGIFTVQSRAPRAWTEAAVELIGRTATMTWSALQQLRTGARLRESEEGFRLLAENIPGICWLANRDGRPYWMNGAGRRYFGGLDLLDDVLTILHPDDVATASRGWGAAVASRTAFEATVRVRGADSGYRPFLTRTAPIRDAGGGISRWCGVLVDLSDRQAQDRRQALLRDVGDRLRDATDVSQILAAAAAALAGHLAIDGMLFAERVPGEAAVTLRRFGPAGADGAVERLTGDDPLRRLHREGEPLVVPDWAAADPALREAPGARAEGASINRPIVNDGRVVAVLCAQTRAPRRWTGEEIELVGEVADRLCSALSRARADEALRERDWSQAFLVDWADELRRVDEPDALMGMTLAALGRYLGATRVTYAELGPSDRIFTTRWNWSDGYASLVGLTVDLDRLGAQLEQEWLKGAIVHYDDVTRDPRVGEDERAIYAARQIEAFVSIPLVRGSSVRAILSVQSARPRQWGQAEIGLIRDVGERTWAVLERARAQAELRARDRDQRFLIAWADSVRTERSPDAIVDTTVRMLAQHLGSSRAAYARMDMNGGDYRIVNEWCERVAPTLGLTYPSSNLSETVRAAYLSGETLVSDDLAADARFSVIARTKFAANQVRARIGVPLARGGVVQAVLSIDEDRARAWTPAEVQLARDVAERMWVLLHRAQAEASLKERERNQAFLVAWSDRIRHETSPRAISAATLAMVGEHLGVDRASFAEAVDGGAALAVREDWRGGVAHPADRRFPLSALGERVLKDYLAGGPVVVRSVVADPRIDDGNRPLYAGIDAAAFVSVPLMRGDGIEAVLTVQTRRPRDWASGEVQLLRDVADRVWAVLERARSEERMADTEALLDAFMHNAPFGMHLKDAGGRHLRVNPELARQVGVPVEGMVGRRPEEFLTPDIGRRVAELDERARAGQIASAEFLVPERSDYAALLNVVFPIPGPRGVERTGGFTLDLTARKTAEAALQKSRDVLHQSEKLTALGSLLAGVSHELNNPLSIVVAQAVMMERQAKGGDLAERAFKIRKAADRCARIVQTFLAMARQKRPERAAVDLNGVVDAALDLTGYGLRADGVAVTFRRADDLPVIAADADQLHQIIVNLLVNAQHAMAGQTAPRTLTLTTAAGPEPETVALDVVDSGPGVPEDVARRIFEPFFTTKGQGDGTGLGLSFSQGLAEAHGGRLVLVPGAHGAHFRLTLPVDADGVLEPAPAPETVAALTPPARRALLVDDEREIAESVADFLALDGFECEIVTSGRQACERIDAGGYDLIVSDLRMPEMDGPALHAWVKNAHPELVDRMGFVTGDTLGSTVAEFLARAGRPVLEKPFTPESLHRFVQEVCGG